MENHKLYRTERLVNPDWNMKEKSDLPKNIKPNWSLSPYQSILLIGYRHQFLGESIRWLIWNILYWVKRKKARFNWRVKNLYGPKQGHHVKKQ